MQISISGGVFAKDGNKRVKDFFVSHYKMVVGETTTEMNTRMSPLGKFFTRHIKETFANNNPMPIGTGRLMTAKRLVRLNKSRTVVVDDDPQFTFEYTFPKNQNVEYGYPLGNKLTKLGYEGLDNMSRWLLSKAQYYGVNAFYYKDKNGKRIAITKMYQARSVAFAMIKAQNRQRKGNVPNWYIIKPENVDVSREMKKWTGEWYRAFVKNFNK